VNTLVLHTDLSRGPADRGTATRELGYQELLARVRRVALGAYAHQDVPFERLVEELQPDRDMSFSPLFQVMFVLQNAPRAAVETAAGLTLSSFPSEVGTAKFDLTLSLQESGTGVSGALEYNTDLFDRTTMVRLLTHFQRRLAAIVDDPEQRLSELAWWTQAERHQLLVEWNDTASAEPPGALFHELFASWAERRPDAVALVFEDQRLSCRELDRRADQLARLLRDRGARDAGRLERPVGICVERSPEMVVGILGILKAGGAWLPLDPEYPRERLAFMAADAGVRTILTRKRFLGSLPEREAEVICLDSERAAVAAESTARIASPTTAEHPAYVIYTSGSTGRPKGVVVKHRGLANLVAAQIRCFELRSGDRLLQFASLNFDASVSEIAMALAAGASLHLAPRERLLPGPPLLKLLREQEITCITLPPSALTVLEAETLPALVTLIVAGEACSPEPAREWAAGRRFYNAYGPTEAAVCATAGRYRGGPRLPIGRPIGNVRVYLLDRWLRVTPIGVPGELCIGGSGVARGYLERPGLTTASFVPDPFAAGRGGGRLYRTGDLARTLPDGTIEFLGRIDHQIKLRGFRIELGEIEAVLSRHPAVREALVLLHEEARLVAFVVTAGASAPAPTELQDLLRNTVPEYMVPSAFVVLDAFPLTPSGKIDRDALERPALPAPGPEDAELAPRDALELELTRIWEELLGVQPIGIRSNFFELGGHSLLAVQLMARVRHRFGRDLPLATLFQEGTVEHLAVLLRQEPGVIRRRALVAIQPRGSRPPWFCVHPAGGNVLSYRDLSRHLGAEQPFYALQVPELEDGSSLTTIEEMAHHYAGAVRELRPQGPYRLGGWSMGGLVAFEMARQLVEQGREVERLVLIDTRAPAVAQGRIAEIDDVALALVFARDLGGISGASLPLSPAELETFTSADEVLSYLWEKLREARIMPPGFDLSQVDRLFAMFRINDRAMRRYVASPYPGRLVLLKADEFLGQEPPPPDLGWGELAVGGLEIREVAGDHYSILREPDVEALADGLKEV
ncbi:MAG: amino acid adenylation domain-containing protein, partial [bacterium]|nr:amino acid adenylation domain-containing protein [bacterium]